jgi:hypothetical protein
MRDKRFLHFSVLVVTITALMFAGMPPVTAGTTSAFPTFPVQFPTGMPTKLPTAFPTEMIDIDELLPECDSWRLEIDITVPAADLPASGVGGSAAEIKNLLSSQVQGLPLEFSVTSNKTSSGGAMHTVVIEGYSTALLRQALFVVLKPVVDVMSMNWSLILQGEALAGDVIDFIFTAIPASGMSWVLDNLDKLNVLEETEFECEDAAPGSPLEQYTQLDILKDGMLALEFLYKRAWEELNAIAPIRITYNLCSMPDKFNLASGLASKVSANPPVASEGPLEDLQVGGVPGSFNWATSNNRLGSPRVSPIKNQGSCGSCWAFGTVGVLESAILVQNNGPVTDLSEQYLLSCNNSTWDCSGGWWAHDYHITKKGLASNPPGGVQESAYPYTGTDSTCKYVGSHPYKLASWHSAGDETLAGVPAIKEAIYNYGPVLAAVCATGFENYTGGVYDKNECSRVNHAIILTGWDDASKSWVLRNSWGSGWGEGGYMRIRWGVNAVGYAANYVVFGGYSPPAPSNVTNTPTPTRTTTKAPPKKTDTPFPPNPPAPQNPTDTPVPGGRSTDTPKPPAPPNPPGPGGSTNTPGPGQATATITSGPGPGPAPWVPGQNTSTTVPGGPSSTPAPGQATATNPSGPGPGPWVPGQNTSTTVPGGPSSTPGPGLGPTNTDVPGGGLNPSGDNYVLPPGTHDNTSPSFYYDGFWYDHDQADGPINGSIHYSSTNQSAVSFAFEGSQFIIGYTAFPEGGVVLVTVDDEEVMLFNEFYWNLMWQQEWESPDFEQGTHVVTLKHILGPQINIDYVTIK